IFETRANRRSLEKRGCPPNCVCSAGGRRGLQRTTTWAQVSVYRQRGTDRTESRRTHRFARQRAEHERLLSGHDEPVPARNVGVGEDFGGRRIFSVQRENRLFANEHGRGSGLHGNGKRFADYPGPLDGRRGKRSAEERLANSSAAELQNTFRLNSDIR